MSEKQVEEYFPEFSKQLSSLKTLSITMEKCMFLKSINIKRLSLIISKYTPGGENFMLSFKSCNVISDNEIGMLGSSVACLSKLKNLELDFSFCNGITDKGLEAIGTIIEKNLFYLQNLKISFEECSMTDTCKKEVFKRLQFIIPKAVLI